MRRLAIGVAVVGAFAVGTWQHGAVEAQVAPLVRVIGFGAASDGGDVADDISTTAEAVTTLAEGMNQDATHDAAVLAAGPQLMGECDDTSTDAVDEGDAGRLRVDCTSREVLTRPIGGTGASWTSTGSTEDEHAVCTGSCVLYSITTTNVNADERYLRCANATVANTTPGSTTPVIDLAVPGNASGMGFSASFPAGFTFTTAATCWLVTGAAQSDVAEVAANELKVFYTKK